MDTQYLDLPEKRFFSCFAEKHISGVSLVVSFLTPFQFQPLYRHATGDGLKSLGFLSQQEHHPKQKIAMAIFPAKYLMIMFQVCACHSRCTKLLLPSIYISHPTFESSFLLLTLLSHGVVVLVNCLN